MDESDGSCYTRCVNRVRFLAALLAFLIPLSGSLPSLANETLWTGSSAASARADALLKAIRSAPQTMGSIPSGTASPRSRRRWRPAPIRATETLLTAAFVAYASDVSTGRVRANRIDKDIDIIQRKVERADLLKAAAEATRFRRLPRRPCRPRATTRRCRRRSPSGATSAARRPSPSCPTAIC